MTKGGSARDDREGDALMTERRLESLYDILQGCIGHGFAEHHVEDVWHFGGVVGHESLGGVSASNPFLYSFASDCSSFLV